MAIDFPNSPTNGQEFTSGGTTWVYDGTKWNIKEATSYSNDSAPVGTILNFAGPAGSIPAGWIACDGSAVSRSTYATLFSVIGTTYGSGNGSTTFNLPDIDGTFGVFIIRWTTTLGVTATDSLYTAPVGAMLNWPTTSSYPAGWLRADGSAVSRTSYADLFILIGTAYGSGDGSTTFNLPNLVETGGPVTIIKATMSGGQPPSTVAHAASHIRGGTDIIDGDRVQIDYVPSAYTRDTASAGGGAVTDLTAHLGGIDDYLMSATGRNRVINGSMAVDQRRSGSAQTGVTGGYVCDRFNTALSGSGLFTLQRVQDGPVGVSGFSSRVTVHTADASIASGDIYYMAHGIEGYNIADLGFGTANAQPVVLSFYVKSSVTGTFGGSVRNGGSGGWRSYPFTYTISSANTWERKTIAFTAATSGTWSTESDVGMSIFWSFGVGSSLTGTAFSWQSSNLINATGSTNLMATAGATWQISGVQFEYGATPTRFEVRSYDDELRRCQRYYTRISTSGGGSIIAMGQAYNTTTAFCIVPLPVVMRITPSSMETTGFGADYALTDSTAFPRQCTTTPAYSSFYSGPTAAYLDAVATSQAAGRATGLVLNTPNAFLGFSAEL